MLVAPRLTLPDDEERGALGLTKNDLRDAPRQAHDINRHPEGHRGDVEQRVAAVRCRFGCIAAKQELELMSSVDGVPVVLFCYRISVVHYSLSSVTSWLEVHVGRALDLAVLTDEVERSTEERECTIHGLAEKNFLPLTGRMEKGRSWNELDSHTPWRRMVDTDVLGPAG